ACGAVLYYFLLSFARLPIFLRTGIIFSQWVYAAWVLLLPAVSLALHEVARRDKMRTIIAFAVASVLCVNGVAMLFDRVQRENSRQKAFRHLVLSSAAVMSTEPYLPDLELNHEAADGLTAEKLDALRREGVLPSLPQLSPSERLQAALRL